MAHSTRPLISQTNRNTDFSEMHAQNLTRCHRCDGLMSKEFCFDLQDETGNNGFWALRCMQCGEILDPLILQNRIAQHPVPIKDRARRKEIIVTTKS